MESTYLCTCIQRKFDSLGIPSLTRYLPSPNKQTSDFAFKDPQNDSSLRTCSNTKKISTLFGAEAAEALSNIIEPYLRRHSTYLQFLWVCSLPGVRQSEPVQESASALELHAETVLKKQGCSSPNSTLDGFDAFRVTECGRQHVAQRLGSEDLLLLLRHRQQPKPEVVTKPSRSTVSTCRERMTSGAKRVWFQAITCPAPSMYHDPPTWLPTMGEHMWTSGAELWVENQFSVSMFICKDKTMKPLQDCQSPRWSASKTPHLSVLPWEAHHPNHRLHSALP